MSALRRLGSTWSRGLLLSAAVFSGWTGAFAEPPVAKAEPPTAAEIARMIPSLRLETYFPVEGEAVSGMVTWINWNDDALAIRRWAYDAQVAGTLPAYRLRLEVTAAAKPDTVLWSQELAFDADRMPPFTLPIASLPLGHYGLTAALVDPTGRAQPFVPIFEYSGQRVSVPARVDFSVVTKRDFSLPAMRTGPVGAILRAEPVGNPSRQIYRKDDASDSYSRSVWDMVALSDGIFLGSGDWERNTGPAPIWRLGYARDGQVQITEDYVVYGEAAERLRAIGGALYVPDMDPREDWNWGNLYIRSAETWRKQRTIPNGIHTFDVREWRNKLYVTCGTTLGAAIFTSADDGASWTRVSCDPVALVRELRFQQMCPVGEELLIMPAAANQGVWVLRPDGVLQPRRLEVFPGVKTMSRVTATRLEPFAGGAVYTTSWFIGQENIFMDANGKPQHRPLYFLTDLQHGAMAVELFKEANVMDVKIEDGLCWVLTAAPEGEGFRGDIHSSPDLKIWQHIAGFSAEAVPWSMARLGDSFFIGLGARSFKTPDKASGLILRLGTANQPKGAGTRLKSQGETR